MKTIIVPLDFSNESIPSLDFAIFMANKSSANILLVHVIKSYIANNEQLEKDRHWAIVKFEEIMRNYRDKLNSNLELSYRIKEGKIFREVTELAKTFEDSMIILSTHGESGFEELFIGGNAYKIASHSSVPVITIRRSLTITNIKKIVLPLDFTFETREKVPFTAELAKLFDSEIHLLAIRQVKLESMEQKIQEYIKQVATYLEKQNISYTIENIQAHNLTDSTIEYANKIGADLISIMSEQEKKISNLLLGTYAHQMINQSFIPVLIFPNYQILNLPDDIWDLGSFNDNN